jgi:subtilase family serine protease
MTPALDAESQFEFISDFQADALPPLPCLHSTPIGCFGADTLRAAYAIQPLLDGGITGAGRTIVVVDAFQNPTIEADLAKFDSYWNIPAPPSFTVLSPYGVPAFDPTNRIQVGWSQEISIDVEWAHAVAPGAAIVLVQANSEKDVDLVDATSYAIRHNLGDVITQSFGEAETCAPSEVLAKQHAAFRAAGERGISVFASSGDKGAARQSCDGNSLVLSASTPASDPNVTGVGGTRLLADGTGGYLSETAWNTASGASGGGFSTIYRRPGYQATAHDNKKSRGVPDVAYNADGTTGYLAVWNGRGGLVHGTSAGAPQWAGIAALADQAAGHRLGALNQRLYRIAKSDAYGSAFHDITTGNNTFGGIAGYSAGPGWDPVTGLGSPQVATLVGLLARDGEGEHEGQQGGESGGENGGSGGDAGGD